MAFRKRPYGVAMLDGAQHLERPRYFCELVTKHQTILKHIASVPYSAVSVTPPRPSRYHHDVICLVSSSTKKGRWAQTCRTAVSPAAKRPTALRIFQRHASNMMSMLISSPLAGFIFVRIKANLITSASQTTAGTNRQVGFNASKGSKSVRLGARIGIRRPT